MASERNQSRTVIITGGGSGIGLGLCRRFLELGDRIVLCGRSEERLQSAVASLGGDAEKLHAVSADVSSEPDVQRLFAAAASCFGPVDILINNAGNFDGGPVEELSLDAWNNVVGACLTGAFLCSRAAFRSMKESGGGRILNIGSISAQRPRMHSAAYTAAKFGVQGLTHATALEGRELGICVSCLHPGNVLVERRENTALDSDSEPMMPVESIVQAAMAMLQMPLDVNFLDAIVLPRDQLYVGRG